MKTVHIIDSHTGGEPTRLVISGSPDLGAGTLAERLRRFESEHDTLRSGIIDEPRGSDIVVGALLCPPEDPTSIAGVLFFNNAGYLGMCGHATIGLIVSLAHLGRIKTGTHQLDTPVGKVLATLNPDGSVSVRNVPSYRYRSAVEVYVPCYGTYQGDIAWGGNWFFLLADHEHALEYSNIPTLMHFTEQLKGALADQGIHGEQNAVIDHIELFAPSTTPGMDSRNFVLCPGGAYDRSPCGTGTSAKMACLAADGQLAPGAIWHQESIVGSSFTATYELTGSQDTHNTHIIPTITGRAHICAESTLIFQDDDPFAWGTSRR